MNTLCNACGINYRRALSKTRGLLDLDALARSMGPSRPSIQKSLKRLRRSAFASHSSSSSKRKVHGHSHGHHNNIPGQPFPLSPSPTSPMSPVGGPSRFQPASNNNNYAAPPNHSPLPALPLPSKLQLQSMSMLPSYTTQTQTPRLPPIQDLLRSINPAYPPPLQHPQLPQHSQQQIYEYNNPQPQPPPPAPRFG